MVDLIPLRTANLGRWNRMVLKHDFELAFEHVARKLLEAKSRYRSVTARTRVPWAIIAVIHERESSQSWRANLAQGDPWDKPSIHVPRSRGPFGSWEDAAIDALVNCPPFTAKNTNWSIGGSLTMLEEYNGLGYQLIHHMASPYLWAGTNQYIKGKYIADGHFDPDAGDHQLGCAGLLRAMVKLDETIDDGWD